MHLRPCRPKPNTRPTQGGTGADAPVEQNRYAVVPVSAHKIFIPPTAEQSVHILMVNVLLGFLVIFSPKRSTYDTIKKAHDRIHATQGV